MDASRPDPKLAINFIEQCYMNIMSKEPALRKSLIGHSKVCVYKCASNVIATNFLNGPVKDIATLCPQQLCTIYNYTKFNIEIPKNLASTSITLKLP